MKLIWPILILLAAFTCQAAAQRTGFTAGRTYYTAGEFKKAVAQFQLAIEANPNDAESHYWMGMSYQALADIAVPFGGKYNSKARVYLTRATELAPTRADYRRELFNFLLDSSASSRTTLRQAASIVLSLSEGDPDYSYMRWRLQHDGNSNSSAGARLGALFLAAPQVAFRIADLPVSALSGRRD